MLVIHMVGEILDIAHGIINRYGIDIWEIIPIGIITAMDIHTVVMVLAMAAMVRIGMAMVHIGMGMDTDTMTAIIQAEAKIENLGLTYNGRRPSVSDNGFSGSTRVPISQTGDAPKTGKLASANGNSNETKVQNIAVRDLESSNNQAKRNNERFDGKGIYQVSNTNQQVTKDINSRSEMAYNQKVTKDKSEKYSVSGGSHSAQVKQSKMERNFKPKFSPGQQRRVRPVDINLHTVDQAELVMKGLLEQHQVIQAQLQPLDIHRLREQLLK